MSIFKNAKNLSGSRNKMIYNSISEDLYTFFADTAPAHGYSDRVKQYDMAEEILEAEKEEENLMVEAGVGIGKTFAYLAPTLLKQKKLGGSIIIATSTIALQEQLAGDVKDIAEMLDIDIDPVIAKGQSHYICPLKADNYLINNKNDALRKALDDGATERKDISEPINDAVWNKICVDHYGKRCRKNCPYVSISNDMRSCPYNDLREELKYATLTICNQDLLTAHFMNIRNGLKEILNYNAKTIIIDEAHNLEDKVRNVTTTELSQNKLINTMESCVRGIRNAGKEELGVKLRQSIGSVRKLFTNIRRQMKEQNSKTDRDIDKYFFDDIKGAYTLLKEMSDNISDLNLTISIMAGMSSRSEIDTEDLERISDSLTDYAKRPEKYVSWIEKNGTLCFCRDNIAVLTNELYFNQNYHCILTSATLTGAGNAVNEQYSYIKRNIGYRGMLSEPKESPFNYDEHAMLYVASDLPHPTYKHDEFIQKGAERIKELLDISKGRALILFTAKKDMQEIAEALKRLNAEYKILVQENGSSQKDILDEFREDEQSVLLGAGTCWEGINIEGTALSNLIIFRLPFPVPDPIVKNRQKRAKDPLMDVLVPDMIIKLKQGIGRLIRSETDKGIVSILDSRLGEGSNRPYKNMIFDALPIKNVTYDIKEIEKFYHSAVEQSCTIQKIPSMAS